MKSFRVLALSILASFVIILAACGGGGSAPKPPATPLSITTVLLRQGTVNLAYDFFMQATGGTGIYTWAITKGTLPKGMTFNGTHAELSGTPTESGDFPLTFQVTDGAGTKATSDLTLQIEGVVIISCPACTGSSLPFGNPNVPYTATLTASGGQAPYTWCVVEPDGSTCDNGSGGGLPPGLTIATVNNQGIISGTPTIPGTPATITVRAADSETPVSRGSSNFTLTIFDVGPKSLPNATLNTPYNQNASAIGGVGPFTWKLTGTLPPGLNFGSCVRSPRPTCAITGAPTQTGTYNFSLAVQDGETPPATASVDLSITVGPLVTNGALKGTYAILLSGYKSGNPYIMAGSFLADGSGNITGGKLDYNDGSGEHYDQTQCRGAQICPIPQTVQTGSTYDLSAGNGTGTITLKTLDYQQNPYTYNFNIVVSGNGTSCTAARVDSSCGRLIESSPQEYGSGVLKVQDPAIFGSFFPGNFGLLVNGTDPAGHRYAAAGALGTNPHTGVDIDCNTNGWGLSGGCPLDTNDNGNNGALATLPDPYGGTFASDVDLTTGRGNFVSLAFTTDPEGLCLGSTGGHYNCGYAYYIINFEEMYMISTDPTTSSGTPYANLTLWSAFRQRSNSGWNVSNISADNIMELSANDAGAADVTVGLMTTDHAGNGAFTSDENDGGTMNQQTAAPGTIAVGAVGSKTGQFLFAGFPQFGSGGAVMYIWSGANNNNGFFVGTDAKVTSGVMETQVAPPGGSFSNSSVAGNYVGATVTPVLSTVTNSVTYLFADGVGNINATQYTSGTGGNHGPNNFALTYQVDATGRGVVNQGQNPFGYLYVIGPEKFALVPTGNAPALNVFAYGQPD